MIDFQGDIKTQIRLALRRSRIVALLGPRQIGKTTVARKLGRELKAHFFDLEDETDNVRLSQPKMALEGLRGLVILDEVQLRPDLFPLLRVLADRRPLPARFLILGSASPDLIKSSAETLAGRVEFIYLSGIALKDTTPKNWQRLWFRGGFPLSYLAKTDNESHVWRKNFISTFLERDLRKFGIQIAPHAMRRFWHMLAHAHGQVLNSAELGASLGSSVITIRNYLDILTGTFMVRQLQPWHANLKKRQVKSPKIYIRDSGILHYLLTAPDLSQLMVHPKLGFSFEGFVIEQLLMGEDDQNAYFWSTHTGAELDLLLLARGKKFGIEIKLHEKPQITKSMKIALSDLELEKIFVIYPGKKEFPLEKDIIATPVTALSKLKQEIFLP